MARLISRYVAEIPFTPVVWDRRRRDDCDFGEMPPEGPPAAGGSSGASAIPPEGPGAGGALPNNAVAFSVSDRESSSSLVA